MEHANMPGNTWSYGARVFYFDHARTNTDNDLKQTPYRQLWGRDYHRGLYTYGCEIAYVLPDTERDKFEGRSATGIFLAYGPRGISGCARLRGIPG